ncbi:MAG TPA: type II/IV secretion system protein, partial [Candidatus Saccharimonadales bacterium]|nr:type II/IV secretion system protein [Candidatus Saccharimonadales bacterium]
VGQRLVRKLCTNCRKSYVPNEEETKAIIDLFNVRDKNDFGFIHSLEEQAIKQHIGKDIPASTDDKKIMTLWRASPDGCDECSHTGYKGRIGIYEVLGITNPIQKLIMANATSDELQNKAVEEGMMTMQTDGLVKALRGETTIEEVLRVTKE